MTITEKTLDDELDAIFAEAEALKQAHCTRVAREVYFKAAEEALRKRKGFDEETINRFGLNFDSAKRIYADQIKQIS